MGSRPIALYFACGAGGDVVDLVAKLAFRHPLRLQRPLHRAVVELAGEVLEGGDAGDLAVDHPSRRGEAVRGPEVGAGDDVDQLVDDLLQSSSPKEGIDVEVRLLLAHLVELPAGFLADPLGGEAGSADLGDRVLAERAELAEAAHAAGAEAGDDDRDQAEEEDDEEEDEPVSRDREPGLLQPSDANLIHGDTH